MGGIIDFSTSCPWELYLFSFWHLVWAITICMFDRCLLLKSTSCTASEKVMESFVVLSLLYIGVMFTVLTYHNKHSTANIMRLSNVALNCSVSLLISIIFIGNASFAGGLETSWVHMGDMLTMIIIVSVLSARVNRSDAEWAQIKPIKEGMGLNCKALLLLFVVATAIKLIAFTDFIPPTKLLKDGSEMTDFAIWMWKFVAVILLEFLFALSYTVLYEDDAGHEIVVVTIMVMTVVTAGSIHGVQQYMSSWMGLNSNALWVRLGIMLLICIGAIIGGRRGSSHRPGYQNVSSCEVDLDIA